MSSWQQTACKLRKRLVSHFILHTKIRFPPVLCLSCGYTIETGSILMLLNWPHSLLLKINIMPQMLSIKLKLYWTQYIPLTSLHSVNSLSHIILFKVLRYGIHQTCLLAFPSNTFWTSRLNEKVHYVHKLLSMANPGRTLVIRMGTCGPCVLG